MPPTLFDASGQPIRSTSDRPMSRLIDLGFEDAGDKLQIDKATVRRLAAERQRNLSISSMPSTPRWMHRTMGGAVEKGSASWPALSFDAIRDLRYRAAILGPIHNAVQRRTRRVSRRWSGKEGSVGWRVVHKDHNESDRETPEYIKPFIKRFEYMLSKPAPRYGCRTTGDLLTLLMEDLHTINRPAVELIHSRVDPSFVVQFRAVDGALLWPTLAFVERYRVENPGWAGAAGFGNPIDARSEAELLSQVFDLDLTTAEWVLVQDNLPIAVFGPNKFIVAPIMNRTDVRLAGYPPSNVEQGIQLIASFIATFDYNTTLFTKGFLTEFMLGISGDVHEDDILTFIDQLRQSTQGVNRAWQPPIMPLPMNGTIQKIDFKPLPGDMQFETLTSLAIALLCGLYGIDPTSVHAKPWAGGGGQAMQERNRDQEIADAKEEGLEGDLGHIAETILTPLAQRCHPDLKVVFEWGHIDPKAIAEIYTERTKVDMTRNEVRLERGDSPKGFWLPDDKYATASDEDRQKHDDNLWNMPADPGFVTAYQADKQAKQAMQQQAAGADGQPPDDGFGGQGDGFGGPAAPGGDDSSPFGRTPDEDDAPDDQGDDADDPNAPPPRSPVPGSPPPAKLQKGRRGSITVHVHDL